MSKAKKAARALDARGGQPQGGPRAWLAKRKTALPALGALLPSVLTAVAIAAAVGAYTPLVFDPDSIVAEASETVAALVTHDAEEEATTSSEVSVAAEPTAVAAVDTGGLQDGTYRGTAYGYKSYITVDVTIKNGKIVAITIVSQSDDEEYFNQAMAVIGRVLKAQSTDVDVVSGCTYSSNGILAAIANALAKASGSSSSSSGSSAAASAAASASAATRASAAAASAAGHIGAAVEGLDVSSLTLADGTYTGCGDGYGAYFYGGDPIEADVTIEGGAITGIELYNYSDDLAYYNKATAVATSVLASQSTNVDVVSGCTYSSRGILAAIEDALAQAAAAAASGDDAGGGDAASGDDAGDEADGAAGDGSSGSSDSEGSSGSSDDASGDDASGDDASGDSASTASSAYADGTYVTYAICGQGATDFDAYYLVLTTVIEDGAVASMTAYGTMSTDGSTLSGSYDESNDDYIELALSTGVTVRVNGMRTKIAGLFTQLVENGTDPDECDVVTGATYSSNAILTAYKAAIEAASSSTLATAAAQERLAAASEGIFLEVLANVGEG